MDIDLVCRLNPVFNLSRREFKMKAFLKENRIRADFTEIELLLVIAFGALLLSILLPALIRVKLQDVPPSIEQWYGQMTTVQPEISANGLLVSLPNRP